jgi:SsrA-binding protein
MAPPATARDTKTIARNRRARHDYDILETLEAGIALQGSEVKSLREGKVQLADAHARVERGEVWLHSVHIAPYSHLAAAHAAPDPDRPRKLLLHRREIDRLQGRLAQDKLTLIPLSLYFKEGKAKVELALARGRRKGDKREAIAKRDADREAERAMARARRGE